MSLSAHTPSHPSRGNTHSEMRRIVLFLFFFTRLTYIGTPKQYITSCCLGLNLTKMETYGILFLPSFKLLFASFPNVKRWSFILFIFTVVWSSNATMDSSFLLLIDICFASGFVCLFVFTVNNDWFMNVFIHRV